MHAEEERAKKYFNINFRHISLYFPIDVCFAFQENFQNYLTANDINCLPLYLIILTCSWMYVPTM